MDSLLSDLLSPRATYEDQLKALKSLQSLLLRRSDWIPKQNSIQHNTASGLFAYISRCLYVCPWLDTAAFQQHILLLKHALPILQGLLLLHRHSAVLASQRHNLEVLLALLTLQQDSEQTPSPDNDPPLSMLALETILCGLADRPENIRAFEQADGVKEVVRILRSKTASKPLRVKCLEVLYFYLLPEDAAHQGLELGQVRPPDIKQLLEATDDEWVPRTPRKPVRTTKDVHLPAVPSLSFSTPRRRTQALEPTPTRSTMAKSASTDSPFTDRRSNLDSPFLARTHSATQLQLGHKRSHSAATSASPTKRRAPAPLSTATNGAHPSSPFPPPSSPRKIAARPIANTPRRPHPLSASLLAPASDSPRLPRSASDDSPLGLSARSAATLTTPSLDNSTASAASEASSVAEAQDGLRSVEQKRRLLARHLGNVDSLVSLWDRRKS